MRLAHHWLKTQHSSDVLKTQHSTDVLKTRHSTDVTHRITHQKHALPHDAESFELITTGRKYLAAESVPLEACTKNLPSPQEKSCLTPQPRIAPFLQPLHSPLHCRRMHALAHDDRRKKKWISSTKNVFRRGSKISRAATSCQC